MACSSPLLGYRMTKVNTYTGEIESGRFRCDPVTHEPLTFIDKRYNFVSSKQYPDKVQRYDYFNRLKNTPGYECAELPCGRCLECRLEYSRQWANRCMLEAASFPDNWFITLTYDDEHLPLNDFHYPTLVKNELSNFMKSLRAYYKYHYNFDNIRFFGCGEYGGKYGRPHYHSILFNFPVYDLEFLYEKNGHAYFNSPSIDKIWNKGFVVFTDVSWDTCAYVARYVVKKAKGENEFAYKDLAIQPEYCRMSRVPGIAKTYFDSHKDMIYKFDKLTIPGVGPVRPSHYYDKLFDIDNPVRMYELKDLRCKVAQARVDLELSQTDLSPLQYNENKHNLLVKKIESLSRDEF